jgi:hypothetical protein
MTKVAALRAPFFRWLAPGKVLAEGDLSDGFHGAGYIIEAAGSDGETTLTVQPVAFVDDAD